MTKSIPTDRHGNVYYGPRTYAEAEEVLQYETENLRTAAEEVAAMMDRAGFSRAAARVRREYHVRAETTD